MHVLKSHLHLNNIVIRSQTAPLNIQNIHCLFARPYVYVCKRMQNSGQILLVAEEGCSIASTLWVFAVQLFTLLVHLLVRY